MRRLNLLLIVFLFCVAISPALAYPTQATVAVRVVNPDGSPVQDIRVVLQNGNYAYLGNGMTNASGICVFAVSPGSSVVRALISSPEYNVTSVWYEAGDKAIEVKLPQVGELSGTIKLGGMGAGNPIVVLDDHEILDSTPYDVSRQNRSELHTFTVNRFSLNMTLGSHRLYAVGYSDNTVYMSDTLTVNVSKDNPQVVLELKPAGNNTSILSPAIYERIFHTSNAQGGPVSIAGNLIGADGMPLVNVTLSAQDYFMGEPARTITGTNGTFLFYSISLSTDIVRFKAVIQDNGTAYTSYSPFYPAENNTSMVVKIADYPKAPVGYIYGIIAATGNRSNPVPISGTVYLSNGQSQAISSDKNNSQFFFTVAPGPYDVYAMHVERGQRLVSEKIHIQVEPAYSPLAVNPTVLVVVQEDVQYPPLAGALIAGALCLAGMVYAMRRWF